MKKLRPVSIVLYPAALAWLIFAHSPAKADNGLLTDSSTTLHADSPLRKVDLVVIDAGNSGSVRVGFHIKLRPGWHLYWANPGDAGLPPSARWTLPPGCTAGPLRHPVPAKSVEEGLVSLKHRGDVLFTCDITLPAAGKPDKTWQAFAVLEWMACRESCVTGETAVKAVFPPDAGSQAKGKRLLKEFGPRFPRPFSESGLTAGAGRAEWTGSAWHVEISLAGPRAAEASDFFAYPVEGFVIENAGVECKNGKIVLPIIPSGGPGSPPPDAVSGVVIIGEAGFEISVPVAASPLTSDGVAPRYFVENKLNTNIFDPGLLCPDQPGSSLVVKRLNLSQSRR